MDFYTYSVGFKIRQGAVTSLDLAEPVCIEGVTLRRDNDDLVGEITIRDEEDASATAKAKQVVEAVIYSLIVSKNVGLALKDLWISSKVADPRQDNLRELFEFVRIRDEVKVRVILGKESLDILAKNLRAFRNLSDRDWHYATRILDWYSKGAMEGDPMDKFIAWYVSLEILGEYMYPKNTFTKRVRQIVVDLRESDNVDEKKLTAFRGTLIHSGQRGDEASGYCAALDAIILKGVRKILERSNS